MGDRYVRTALAVVLQAEFRTASAFNQHVLEHGATDQREVVVIGDVAQRLRGSVGAVLLGRRAGECFGVSARLALHAAE